MKKTNILLAAALLTGVCGSALGARRGTVVMPVQVVQGDSSFKLPSKTDYMELRCMRFDDKKLNGFDTALREKLQAIDDNDAEHYAFALVVWPDGSGLEPIKVEAYDRDPLKSTEVARRMAYGDYQVGEAHFVLIMNPDNADFLKQYARPTGMNTRFERVYEYVPEIFPKQHTTLHATWDGKQMTTTAYILDGEDQLHDEANGSATAASDSVETVTVPVRVYEGGSKNAEAADSAVMAQLARGGYGHEFMTNPTDGLVLNQLQPTSEACEMRIVQAALDKLKAIAKAEKAHNTLIVTLNTQNGYPKGIEVSSGDVIKLSASQPMAGVVKIGGVNFVIASSPEVQRVLDEAVESTGMKTRFTHMVQVSKSPLKAQTTGVTMVWKNGDMEVTRSLIDGRYVNVN